MPPGRWYRGSALYELLKKLLFTFSLMVRNKYFWMHKFSLWKDCTFKSCFTGSFLWSTFRTYIYVANSFKNFSTSSPNRKFPRGNISILWYVDINVSNACEDFFYPRVNMYLVWLEAIHGDSDILPCPRTLLQWNTDWGLGGLYLTPNIPWYLRLSLWESK